MGNDKDTISQSKVWVNGSEKPGIMVSETVTYPPLEIGPDGRAALPLPTERERLLESISDLEKYAKSMVAEGIQRQLGKTEPEPFSFLEYAIELEKTVIDLKRDVLHFEKNYADFPDASYFYFAVENAMKVGRAKELLAIKMFELDIVRGSDDSYNHNGGASTATQAEAVEEVRKLVSEGHSQNKATEIVGRKVGKKPGTVKGWIYKLRKK